MGGWVCNLLSAVSWPMQSQIPQYPELEYLVPNKWDSTCQMPLNSYLNSIKQVKSHSLGIKYSGSAQWRVWLQGVPPTLQPTPRCHGMPWRLNSAVSCIPWSLFQCPWVGLRGVMLPTDESDSALCKTIKIYFKFEHRDEIKTKLIWIIKNKDENLESHSLKSYFFRYCLTISFCS